MHIKGWKEKVEDRLRAFCCTLPLTAFDGDINEDVTLDDGRHSPAKCGFTEGTGSALPSGRSVGGTRRRSGQQTNDVPHRTFQEYLAGCYLFDERVGTVARTLSKLAEEDEYWNVAVELFSSCSPPYIYAASAGC
jgi:hypothetical protein